jgi:hypothetical protein
MAEAGQLGAIRVSSLYGSAVGPNGEAITWAKVVLTRPDTSQTWHAQTNWLGWFQFDNLEAGEYCAAITATGMNPHSTHVFPIDDGARAELQVYLNVVGHGGPFEIIVIPGAAARSATPARSSASVQSSGVCRDAAPN